MLCKEKCLCGKDCVSPFCSRNEEIDHHEAAIPKRKSYKRGALYMSKNNTYVYIDQ